MRTGRPLKRSVKVAKCWRASSVVGTTTATCRPAIGRDEGRAQRHLGLAEADIAAHQPVHGLAGGQVVQHGLDAGGLVLGLLVGEAGDELVVLALRRRQGGRLAQLAQRRDLDQLRGDLADALLEARLAASARPTPPSRSSWARRRRRSRSGTAARCSRPAGRACRRRRSRSPGSRAGAPSAVMVVSPSKRPMPWSACTTRSPMARLVASVMRSAARRALRRGRISRSPRMSCSPMTARSGVSKPCSRPSTAKPTLPDGSASASA